jgi:hypothetical protein
MQPLSHKALAEKQKPMERGDRSEFPKTNPIAELS